jgi:plasmid stabilization system protein ParE
MALRYRILPEAKQELVDAAAYHERQREGLGLRLFDEYDAVIEHAREFPDSGKRIDLGSGHQVRCFQMRRFRYSVFSALVGEQLVVFCISHHKRRPGYWAERLKEIER